MTLRVDDGRTFSCDDSYNAEVIEICSAREYDVPESIRFALSRPLVILDIGAHSGAFAAWATSKWPGAVLHCYEPNPRTLPHLRANAPHFFPAAELHEVAVFDRAGEMTFDTGHRSPSEASLYDVHLPPTHEALALVTGRDDGQTCAVRAIDAHELPDADILKLDTEGAEPTILRRYFARAGRRPPAIVLVETHRRADRYEIEAKLATQGLDLVRGRILSAHAAVLTFVRRDGLVAAAAPAPPAGYSESVP